jgi:CelD/BcsL family acetyltransferase involved in cellulose biosynthesis
LGLSVRIVDDVAGFAALQPAWDALLRRSRTATVFSTFEWNWTAWDYKREVSRPFILQVFDGEELVALLPLRSLSEHEPKTLVPIGVGYKWLADYVDLVVAEGYEELALDEALRFLARQPGWRLLEWPELNQDSPTFAAIRRSAEGAGLYAIFTPGSACRRVELPESWPEFVSRLSPKMRKMQRLERKLAREHEVRFERLTEETALEPAFAAAQTMQERRWAGGAPSQEHVAYMGFLKRLAPLLLRRGWLDAQTLRVDGSFAAVMLAFSFGDTTHGCLTAFEATPVLESYGIGTLSIAQAFRTAIADRKRVFDLARGNDAYKARWASELSRNYRVRIVRSRARFLYYVGLESLRRLKERVRPTQRSRPTKAAAAETSTGPARGPATGADTEAGDRD